MSSETFSTFVAAEFRAFVFALNNLEKQILVRTTGAGAGDDEITELPEDPAAIRKGLVDLLAQQTEAAAKKKFDTSSRDFKHGQHFMAVCADWLLMGLDWWGQPQWRQDPLVTDYPPPEGVASGVVEQLQQVVDERRVDLAATCLLVLAMDFEGKSQDGDGDALLGDLRRRLFELTLEPRPTGDDGVDAAEPGTVLFPRAYLRAQRRGETQYLPGLRGWLLALTSLVAVLFVASFPVWLESTHEARQLVDLILGLLR